MDTNERNFLKLIVMVVLVIMVLSSNYNYRNKLIKEREMTILHIPKYNGVHGDTTKYMFEEHTTIEEDFNAANPATAVGNAFTKKPGKIIVSIGKPISPEGHNAQSLMREVENWIESEMRVITPTAYLQKNDNH